MPQTPQLNVSRLEWDLRRRTPGRFEEYWDQKNYTMLKPEHFEHSEVWLEIGAGTGGFFVEMARKNPEVFLIAIERDKARGQRLVRKAGKSGLANLAAYRGNAIPAMVRGVPDARIDRTYILYPCPWPKTAHRRNRWYLHPIMPHLVRTLKPGGRLVWASDQEFYIDEARFVCESRYGLEVLAHGAISPNPYNDLEAFPGGRTKFERTFLEGGQPCYELVVRKP